MLTCRQLNIPQHAGTMFRHYAAIYRDAHGRYRAHEIKWCPLLACAHACRKARGA